MVKIEGALAEAAEAKVGDFRDTAARHEDVGRFDVAMDDLLRLPIVQVRERAQHIVAAAPRRTEPRRDVKSSVRWLSPRMHRSCTSLAAMAARATRSASRKARLTEAVATGPLGALSHDELGVIVDGLADPLQPVVAVALSSTCLGLRTPLRAALEVLKERHARAKALCWKVGMSCAALRGRAELVWQCKGLTADDIETLGMILRTSGLPRLQGHWATTCVRSYA